MHSQQFKFILPALVGAAGAIGTGLIGGLFGASSNKRNVASQEATNAMNLQINRETNAANAAINERSIEAQYQLQKDAQAWNSEVAQATRMRAAGLNPANMGINSSSMSASTVPSSIPQQAAAVNPVQSNSDTFVNPIMQGVLGASSSFADFAKGQETQLGNQYLLETFQKRVDEQGATLDYLRKLLEEKGAQTDEHKAAARQYDAIAANYNINTRLLESSFDDMSKAQHLQNLLVENQTKAAMEQSRLYASNVITDGLNRILAQRADNRENRIATAQINSLLDQAYYYSSMGRLNDVQWDDLLNTAEDRYEQIANNNELTKAQRVSLYAQMGIFEQQIENLRKQNQSFWLDKGFGYVHQLGETVRDIGIGIRGFGSQNVNVNNTNHGVSGRGYHINDTPSPVYPEGQQPMTYTEWLKRTGKPSNYKLGGLKY